MIKHIKRLLVIIMIFLITLISSYFVNAMNMTDDFETDTTGNYSGTLARSTSYAVSPTNSLRTNVDYNNPVYYNKGSSNLTLNNISFGGWLSTINGYSEIQVWKDATNYIRLSTNANTNNDIVIDYRDAGTHKALLSNTSCLYNKASGQWFKFNVTLNRTSENNQYWTIIVYNSTGFIYCMINASTTVTWLDDFNVTIGFGSGSGSAQYQYFDDVYWNDINQYIIPSILPLYNITTTKVPNDINSSVIGEIQINATIRNLTGNVTINNNSFATLYYNVTSVVTPCAIYEQKRCVDGTIHSINMTKINNTYYTYNLTEKNIFPAYYPFNQDFIEKNAINNYSVYLNNNIRFKVYNFTTYTNPFISMEFDAINLSGTSIMGVYYCNSSYSTGNPSGNVNCEFLQSIPAESFDTSHCHGNSCHYVFPVFIRNVTKTQISNFIIISSATPITNGYRFKYALNSSYDNTSFETGNYVGWVNNSPNIFDIHIHQFLANDSFRYWVYFNDGINYTNSSSVHIDYFDIINQPPSAVGIYTPNSSQRFTVSNTTNTSLFFSWTPSYDFENDTLSINITLVNSLGIHYLIKSGLNITPYNYTSSINALFLIPGFYTAHIGICDNSSNCVESVARNSVYLCENNYRKSLQPCLDSIKLISYYDYNDCDDLIDSVPIDNATYEACVIPTTQGETNITNGLYVVAISIFILAILIIRRKRD